MEPPRFDGIVGEKAYGVDKEWWRPVFARRPVGSPTMGWEQFIETFLERYYRSLVGLFDFLVLRPCGKDFLQEALDSVWVIQDRLRSSQTMHKSYADCRCRPSGFGALPPTFSVVHLIFHVSMFHQYVPDESHVLQYDLVELDDRFNFVDDLIAIQGRDVRQLLLRAILVVEVHLRYRRIWEDT
ncbi:hypothetical protein MTR67_026043 [Solanum verrucosum]|uniref:Reverse transcriptase domain-containing protein n=1 Tax=Solanum verrucosum TaxID=315347 RepID=A0AAF0R215_SOLVR|nr:hypothetical protein MTR67_026043 [Solanum verrucosum]